MFTCPPGSDSVLSELGESPELYREHANRLGAYDPNYTPYHP